MPVSAKAQADFERRFGKNFGEKVLVRGGAIAPYEVISTGSIELDYALGVGGWVVGRINEIYGVDDIGKTTLAFMACREAQRKYPNKMVGYVDMEGKADLDWMEAHGVDRNRMYLVLPESAEQVSDQMKLMVTDPNELFSLVVLDSIGAMIPQAEHDKEADEVTVAAVAKIVTRMTKSNHVWAGKHGVCLLWINQVRANINSSGRGPDTITTGGWALKFGSTIKVKLARTDQAPYIIGTDRDKITVGHELGALVERSKVSPKGRTAYMSLITVAGTKYGPVGIDQVAEAANLGVKLGIIDRSGGWYTLPGTGERLQGIEAVKGTLRSDPALVAKIRSAIVALRADEVIMGDAAEVTPEEMEAQPVQEPAIAPQKAPGSVKRPAKASPAKKPALRRGAAAAKKAARAS